MIVLFKKAILNLVASTLAHKAIKIWTYDNAFKSVIIGTDL
jgi:hypothetical protein